VFERSAPDEPGSSTLTRNDILRTRKSTYRNPVTELYEDIAFRKEGKATI